jgi:hypothetical protein
VKDDDITEEVGGINFIMEKYIEETFGQVEVRWNGYSYAVGPSKGEISKC